MSAKLILQVNDSALLQRSEMKPNAFRLRVHELCKIATCSILAIYGLFFLSCCLPLKVDKINTKNTTTNGLSILLSSKGSLIVLIVRLNDLGGPALIGLKIEISCSENYTRIQQCWSIFSLKSNQFCRIYINLKITTH